MSEKMFSTGDQDYGSMKGWDPDKAYREKLLKDAKKRHPKAFAKRPDLLYVVSAPECAERAATWLQMKQLFGPLWREQELAVMYSSPGVGKSALAVQIAECLARGRALTPFDKPPSGCEVEPLRVLYLDFELTATQFVKRYATTGGDGQPLENLYRFSPDLLRGEMYWNGEVIDGYDGFTDMLMTDIEGEVSYSGAQVLICDNITFLSRGSTASAGIAFRLMNRLQELKKTAFISILAIAHTPKRSRHQPITERDLQGSIDITKVADSVFALAPSSVAPELRYIKQIKSRSGPVEYGERNVLVYRAGKFDLAAELGVDDDAVRADNFFGFSYLGTDSEDVHLPAIFRPRRGDQSGRLDRSRIALAKLLSREGLRPAEIARKLGVGRATAYRYLTLAGKQPVSHGVSHNAK